MAGKNENSQKYPEPCAAAVVENSKGEILLIASPKWNNKYTIPGGHIEVGEKTKDAMVREVREETGLDVVPVMPLNVEDGIFPKSYHRKKHFIFHDFLARVVGSEEVKIDSREASSYVWISPERAVKELDIDEYTRSAIDILLRVRGFSKDVSESAKGMLKSDRGKAGV